MPTEKSQQVIHEMVQTSAAIIKFCERQRLPRSVIDQITRSVTSIGANFSEAQDAGSKRDFVNKIFIAKKEAAETNYWLLVVTELAGSDKELVAFQAKIKQFLRLLQKIVNTARDPHR